MIAYIDAFRGRADLQDVAVRPIDVLVGEAPAEVCSVDPRRRAEA